MSTRIVWLVALVVGCALICHIHAATFQMNNVRVVDGSCEHPQTKEVFAEVLLPENDCVRLSCDVRTKTIYGESCSSVAGAPGCKKVAGSGTYPNCCPTMKC